MKILFAGTGNIKTTNILTIVESKRKPYEDFNNLNTLSKPDLNLISGVNNIKGKHPSS